MNNISAIHNCYGCGVCSASCPKKIISINLNENGFYEPRIVDDARCVDCGICLDVCSFNHSKLAVKELEIKSWAAWSNDERVRRKCSSGGIGFEIGRQLIAQGYKAVGCRYDTSKQRAEHFIASTIDQFAQSIGSKYIQSYTEEAFKQIKRTGQNYFVTGTPCQIDSFRRMIQKFRCEDNFILLDFFCHCVPSMYAWKSYIKMLEPKIGNITYASWRNKYNYGWHDSWLMALNGDKDAPNDNALCDDFLEEKETQYKSRMSQGDLFYRLFLGDICLGPQCEKNCKYKYDQSSADIRIGDLWGNTYFENQEGVSALISFTPKGRETIERLNDVTLIEHPFNVVAEGQMKQNAQRKEIAPIVLYLLRNNVSLTSIAFRFTLFSQRIINKLKKLL